METTTKNRDGLNISVLVEPGKKGRLVFIAHGLGGFKDQDHIRAFADAFKEAGYTVVRWDATSSLGKSDGNYEDATTSGYMADFEDVVAWATSQPWYVEPFVLSGHSLGSYCSALYAERHPSRVKAVAPISVMVSGRLSHEAHQQARPEDYDEWKRTGITVVESQSMPGVIKHLKWSHMEDRLKHDLMPDIGKLTMPVLLIVGENDEATPVKHHQLLLQAIPATSKELHIIKGAPHTFRKPKHLVEVKALLSDWLKRIDA